RPALPARHEGPLGDLLERRGVSAGPAMGGSRRALPLQELRPLGSGAVLRPRGAGRDRLGNDRGLQRTPVRARPSSLPLPLPARLPRRNDRQGDAVLVPGLSGPRRARRALPLLSGTPI